MTKDATTQLILCEDNGYKIDARRLCLLGSGSGVDWIGLNWVYYEKASGLDICTNRAW